jgi:hypothetical protein
VRSSHLEYKLVQGPSQLLRSFINTCAIYGQASTRLILDVLPAPAIQGMSTLQFRSPAFRRRNTSRALQTTVSPSPSDHHDSQTNPLQLHRGASLRSIMADGDGACKQKVDGHGQASGPASEAAITRIVPARSGRSWAMPTNACWNSRVKHRSPAMSRRENLPPGRRLRPGPEHRQVHHRRPPGHDLRRKQAHPREHLHRHPPRHPAHPCVSYATPPSNMTQTPAPRRVRRPPPKSVFCRPCGALK